MTETTGATGITRLAATLEAGVFRALLGLPPRLVRRLAGRPVVLDGQLLDAETQWLLRLQRLTRDPGLSGSDVSAIRQAARRSTRLAGGRQPVGETLDLEVPGGAGPVPARLYTPTGRVGSAEPAPLLVFLHGGGMVFGDLDTHDASCRLLAERADVQVLAVDYRLAPEHPFPAAVEDCWAAFGWAAEHTEELGVDPERVAVGGDSAGGTLAAVTAIKAAGAGVPLRAAAAGLPGDEHGRRQREPAAVRRRGSSSPATSSSSRTTSYVTGRHRAARPAGLGAVHREVPAGLAPAHVVTAGFDPLRDEGEAYARTLADAGVRRGGDAATRA